MSRGYLHTCPPGTVLLAALLWAHSSGPAYGHAGDPPGKTTCSTCHSSFHLNSGDGSLSVDNVPGDYVPEETYAVRVTLSGPGQSRWAFQLAVLGGDSQQAGVVVVTDATTQLSDGPGTKPDYVKHTSPGTCAGTNDGPVSWEFNWTAPAEAVGRVTFYTASNAANNNGSTEEGKR